MNILSVYPLPGVWFAHDGAACLIGDDGLLYVSEEERHLRAQHAVSYYPERSVMLALKQCGLAPHDIDRLVVSSFHHCWKQPDYRSRLRFVRNQALLPDTVPVSCVPHHIAHTALAVLTSPFDECIFLTLDGGGDRIKGHWGTFRRGRFRVHEHFSLSPALVFSFVTSLCGFPLFEEGKVMGLASYGSVVDPLLAWFRRSFRIAHQGAGVESALRPKLAFGLRLEKLDVDSFARHKFCPVSVSFEGADDIRWIHEIPPADIARTGQHFFQELLMEIVANLVDRTGLRAIACSGGVFLNAAANGYLARHRSDVDFFVPMAPHDAGLALGAALWTRHIHGRPRLPFPVSPHLGPVFTADSVRDSIRKCRRRYEQPPEMLDRVARAIADGKVVGWFNGRAEHGARALGARSVLADPRNPLVKARVNQLLKKRDWFMPYAPSILEEFGAEYFEDFKPSPYMNVAFKVRPEKIGLISAAVHVDGTCRAQSVSRSLNPQYHALITRFHQLTGVPMILNTSFNQHGLPMVSTPQQAIQHVVDGCVDLLAIEGFLVHGRSVAAETETVDEQTLLALTTLRHAASLAQSGRVDSANAVLRYAGIPVLAGETGFAHNGELVWSYQAPIGNLDGWWCSRVTRRARPKPDKALATIAAAAHAIRPRA